MHTAKAWEGEKSRYQRGRKEYVFQLTQMRLPIVVVVNKCDEMAPTRFKTPSEYPENKVAKINEVVQYYKGIIVKNGLKIDNIIPVSSLIDWQAPDGIEVGVEDIENLPKYDVDNLQFAFDGRYRIEELLDILEEAILDYEAQLGLRMAARLNEVVQRIAKHLNNIFSGISATVTLTPIPISDIYLLLILQSVLVALIASLSGKDISLETAKEFILCMGGIAGAGYAFRLLAQQASKFLNKENKQSLRMLYKYQYYLTEHEKRTNFEWGNFIRQMDALYQDYSV